MADRALRGMRLGTQSLETTAGAELAARKQVRYNCPDGHVIELTFAHEAEVPLSWECNCGVTALLDSADIAVSAPETTGRTHWDMLLERRTIAELEEILAERLEVLRASRRAAS